MGRTELLLGLAILMAGCGGSSGTDAGMPPPDGGGPGPDGGSGYPFPDLPALTGYDESPVPAVAGRRPTYSKAALDLSCAGALTEPVGGDLISAEFLVLEFSRDPLPYPGASGAGDPVPLDIAFFNDNALRAYRDPSECAAPDCQLVHPDTDTGLATVQVRSGGWYSYSVFPRAVPSRLESTFALAQINEPAPTTVGETIVGRWISVQNAEVLMASAGFSRLEGSGAIAGAVVDCRPGEPRLMGAVVRLFDPSGTEVLSSPSLMQPQLRYFTQAGDNRSPNEDELFTTENGLYMWAQLPPRAEPYRVEAWGRRAAGGPIELIGCEEVQVGADGVTAANILPLRLDRPASCPQSP